MTLACIFAIQFHLTPIYELYHFSSYLAHFTSILWALRYSSNFSIQQRSITQNTRIGEKMRSKSFKLIILPNTTSFDFFKYLISHPYTSISHFLSYIAYILSLVSKFTIQQRSVTQNMKMGEKNCPTLLMTLSTQFWDLNSSHTHIRASLIFFIISCTFSKFSWGLLDIAVVFPSKKGPSHKI